METLSKADLKKIRKLQLKMEHLATDILAGMYRSAFKGRGMEFEEVREYQNGDEVRSIDWNVTARMGTPYVKLFREERELTVIFMVDVSASTRFGSGSTLKKEIISEIGAVLAFSGIKNQDKIGLLLYSDQVEHYLPPAKGIRHVLRLIRDLMIFKPQHKGTDLEAALKFLGNVQKKRCVLFILSDFQHEGNYQNEVAVTAKSHDLIAIAVNDPLEHHLPDVGLIEVEDLETGEMKLIDTSSEQVRKSLSTAFEQAVSKCKRIFKKSGAEWIQVASDQSYMTPLRKFLLQHKAKR